MSDNTGVVFRMKGRLNERETAAALKLYFNNPVVHGCAECGEEARFLVTVDNDNRTGLAMLTCTRCKKSTPPFELRKPQMRGDIERRTGLVLPNPHLSSIPIDFELGPDMDED